METRPASDVAQLPRNNGWFPEKHSCERENRPPSIREQAIAGGNESAFAEYEGGVRTLTFESDVLSRRVSLKYPVWQRRLLVPAGSYTRKTLAIGR